MSQEAKFIFISDKGEVVDELVFKFSYCSVRHRFEYLPGVAHFPYLEAPEQTAQLITAFFASDSR